MSPATQAPSRPEGLRRGLAVSPRPGTCGAALTCGRRRRRAAPCPAGWSSWRRRSRSPSPAAAGPAPAPPPARPGPARPPAVQQDGGARSPRRPSALGKGFLYGTAVNRHGGRRMAAAILAEGPPRGAAAEGGRLPAPLACLFLAAGRPPPDERLEPPPACPRRSGAAFPGAEGRGPAASVQHDGRARPPEFLGAYSRRAAPMGGAAGPLARRRRSASHGPAFPPPTRRLSALRRSVPYDNMAAPSARCGAPELEKTANRRAGRR